ncbi:hypothetical protein IL992_23480 [Microbispora sp. NEAU-D428]|uniref:PKD domain-containing protein n=1 Tax=Microbispora sitophila TaxID=2771537 RepID=UPI001868D7A9|nr:PKD domain-containing protein [Microbispora sitophila]MBE3012136.1 hypothetical protein [Microbispora sitophila]
MPVHGLRSGDRSLNWLLGRASVRRTAIALCAAVAGPLALPAPALAAPSSSASTQATAEAGEVKLIDLGSLNHRMDSDLWEFAGRINNKGQVAGYTYESLTGAKAVLFSAEGGVPHVTDIHSTLPDDPSSSAATDVSDDGTVVGFFNSKKASDTAFLFRSGAATSLEDRDFGRGVNNKGQAVGGIWTEGWVRDADGSILKLAIPGFQVVEPEALNNHGSVTGVFDANPDRWVLDYRAFRTKPGEPIDPKRDALADLAGEGSSGVDINDEGEVAGYAKRDGGYRPVIWDKNGTPHEQVVIGGGKARAINSAGIAVGNTYTVSGPERAALFENGVGIDLNTLRPEGSTSLTLRRATGINDLGQIAGIAEDGSGVAHAFLLDLGQPDPVVESVTFETQEYPSRNWVPVPEAGARDAAIDGNVVRVKAVVRNPGPYPVSTKLQLVENVAEKSLLKDGATDTELDLAPGEKATVSVNWNTSGFAWRCTAVTTDPQLGPCFAASDRSVTAKLLVGGSERDHRTESIKIRPKPVVLVHGFNSNAEKAWGSYQALLTSGHPLLKGYAVDTLDTGDITQPTKETLSIQQNAERLASAIDRVRTESRAWHVDVIAHSAGGLITRQYIQYLMPGVWDDRPVVNRMLQMGTPNMGTPCAKILARKNRMRPLAAQLTPFYMSIFNRDVTRLRGVRASNLVGVGRPIKCIAVNPTPVTKELGDFVVPQSSAEFNYPDIVVTKVSHTRMTTSGPDFLKYVKPRLASLLADWGTTPEGTPFGPQADVKAESGVKATAAADAAAVSEGPSSFALPSATVEPGQTVSVPVEVPQGKAFGVTGVLPSTVGLLLRDPSGKPAASYAAGSEEAEQPIQGLSVNSPQPGAWTLEITNTAGQRVQADLVAWVDGSPVQVVATVQQPSDEGRVRMTATVTDDKQPVTGVPVKAVLTAEDGTSAELELKDDGASGDGSAGDGVYGATSEPLADGVTNVIVRAETAKGSRDAQVEVEVRKPDLREFALELSAQRGGSVSASPAQDTYRSGTVVTITPTADAGRMPLGWIVDGEERPGGGVLTLVMDGPHTVVARFGSYTVTEIRGLSDGSFASGVALNDAGQVATLAAEDGKWHAVRWQAGEVTDLGALPCSDEGSTSADDCEAAATGINEAGDVSGWSFTTVDGHNEQHAVVFGAGGSVKDLTPAGKHGMALDLNDNGQVFGIMCSWADYCPEPYVIWDGGVAAGLPSEPKFGLPTGEELSSRINARGAVAGGYVTDSTVAGATNWSPAVSQDGVTTKLEIPDCVSEGGVAHDVNNLGVVAGDGTCNDGKSVTHHAYLWEDGRRTDLGPGSATAINDSGLVAGMFGEPEVAVPALWLGGKRYALADLLPRPLCPAEEAKTTQPCMGLDALVDVNSSGQILARGFVRDRSATSAGFTTSGRSFLLSPTKAQADLEVTTQVSAAEPGPTSTVTWTATVVNKGEDAATDVRLDVLIPHALAATAKCDTWRGKCTPFTDGFRNTVKVLEPGWSAKVEISATVPADMADGTELKVQANADSVATADPQPGNNGASVTATVRPLLDKTGVNWPEPVKVGSTSYPVTVTLTNRLNAPIPLKAIAVEGPFAQSNSCPVELPVGDTCVVTLTFSPTAGGAVSGKLTFTTADGAAPAYTVTLSGTGTANVNAKPVVQVPATPLRGTVGKPFTLSVDFTDADTSDQHTAQVAWGDGPPVTATVDQKPGGGTVTATKTFTGPTSGMAVVMVSDGKDTTWQGIPYVIEEATPNTAPVVTAGPDAEVSIGEQFGRWASFADDDSTSWTATVDYGDGTGPQPQPLEGWQIPLAHKWAAAGTYMVTVKVKDDGGKEGTASFTVTVLSADTPNQAPKVTLLGYDTPTEAGSEWVGRGSFTDPDSSSWTYTADYGDGAGPQPLALTAGQLKLSHVFDAAGDYTVVLTVTDDKGGSGSAQLVVHITNPAPEATLKAAPATVAVGEQVTLTGSFTDKAKGDTHTATWSIGKQQVTGAVAEHNGKGTLTLPYVFTKPGLYQVSVTVADNHGARTTADTAGGRKVQVLVFDRDASLAGTGTLTVPAGACKVNAECATQEGTVSFTVSAHYPAKGKGKAPAGKVSYTAPGFELKDASLSVLSAADGTAILRGTGQVKGAGKVTFEITATDTGAGDKDRFHLVAWDAKDRLVYDNQPTGAPAPVNGVLRVAG